MNCRDFQNEFEERSTLSQTATLHLDSCANCQKYHFEQTRLWEMLGGLQRVETPPDFNFQLKARIARAKPEDYRTGFFPALRYILPLSFAVVLISFVALSGLYFVDQNSLVVNEPSNSPVNTSFPADSFVEPKPVISENNPPVDEIPNSDSADKQPEVLDKKPDVAQNNDGGGSKDLPNKMPNLISPPDKKDSGGGSGDHSLTPPKVITPEGFEPNQKIEPTVNPIVTTTDLNGLLEITGIKTDSSKVISVKPDGVGDRSGVKVGDKIEAINGKKITGDKFSGQSLEVKTLTVLRGGERLEIVLGYQ